MSRRRTAAVASLSLAFVAAFALALAAAQTGASTESLDGKQIFLSQNCQACHAVSTAGIEAKGKAGGDLSAKTLPEDSKVIGPYLRQKSEVRGKKHMKAFTGSDEELGAVIAWLTEQQKQKATKAK